MTLSPVIALYQQRLNSKAIQPDASQATAIEHLAALSDALVAREQAPQPASSWWQRLWSSQPERQPTPKGLYLYGPVGRGKTLVMDLFFEALPLAQKRRVHFHAFLQEAHASLNQHRQAGDENIIKAVAEEIAKTTHVLCFDEFVVYNLADAMVLGRLYQALHEAGVVMVATSNFPPTKLYEGGLHRDRFEPYIALIAETTTALEVDFGQDYRRQALAGEAVYFHPLDAHAKIGLNRLFHVWADGHSGQPTELAVGPQRTLIVSCAYQNRIAWFLFEDLCAKPLGAQDYLAITEAYQALIIEGVPTMGPERRNEARRFITLIDAAYDHKTQVMISAAAPPDALYTAGSGANEFQRTASRLIEMQSKRYRGVEG